MVQYQSHPEKIDLLKPLDQKSGFIIAPFFQSTLHDSYILEPDNIFLSDQIDYELVEQLAKSRDLLFPEMSQGEEIMTTPYSDFIQQVNDAKRAINNKEFFKVVLSKVRVEKQNSDFDASSFFLRLCEKYPHAFVSLVQLPEVGCWIGATPEPLLVSEGGKVKTVSLAGTQLATDAELESYQWSKKEIEEQGIVTGYVEKTLKLLHVDNYTLKGPENYRAANLIHLKTSFEFKETETGNRLSDLLNALHPTPSVGGLPKDEARHFILKNENHDRSYYSGFLGPLNIDNKSHLFVNLRCLQLFQKQFVLYSGAGITASSVAENEWEETENKMMTMMNVMQKS